VLDIRKWLASVASCAAVALTACGGGGSSSDSTSVRVVNATLSHASIDLLANGSVAIGTTPIDNASGYATVPAGSPTLQINDSATGSALATLTPSVGKDSHFVVVAFESGGVLRTTVIAEDTAAPVAGSASLRVFDAATDAGAIDVFVTDPAVDITTLSSPTFSFSASTSLQTSGFLAMAPGTYRVRVTGAGNPQDLRLDMPAVTLTNQQIAALFFAPTVGGTLVNGAALVQQGAYTAGRNTSARVRVAAAVASAATVSADAGAVAIAANVVAPSVGAYVLVPAGAAINVGVNGNSVAAPTAGLAAGSDSTLLVYGSAAAPTASLVADDNHLPTTSGNLKLRLLDGLTGAAAPLNLDAAFAVIASNVVPGTASSYAVVASSTALRVDVFSPTSLTPIYSDSALSVPGNAVYTLFMLGDAAAPIPLLRRDR
jgi:Domain of unknown function (DUF4397)